MRKKTAGKKASPPLPNLHPMGANTGKMKGKGKKTKKGY